AVLRALPAEERTCQIGPEAGVIGLGCVNQAIVGGPARNLRTRPERGRNSMGCGGWGRQGLRHDGCSSKLAGRLVSAAAVYRLRYWYFGLKLSHSAWVATSPRQRHTVAVQTNNSDTGSSKILAGRPLIATAKAAERHA